MCSPVGSRIANKNEDREFGVYNAVSLTHDGSCIRGRSAMSSGWFVEGEVRMSLLEYALLLCVTPVGTPSTQITDHAPLGCTDSMPGGGTVATPEDTAALARAVQKSIFPASASSCACRMPGWAVNTTWPPFDC